MSMPDMVTGSRRAMKNLYTPPAMVPERPSASSMAAVSRSKLVWPEVAGAGGGVSVASSADRTARARSAASPWPAMWVHQIGGDCSSRCLCSAVCCRPPACTASVTEASSSSVTTRSPISMVCPSGVRANATHDPSDSAGATVTPLVCTLRSERANPIL